jgi:hypothetical protein
MSFRLSASRKRPDLPTAAIMGGDPVSIAARASPTSTPWYTSVSSHLHETIWRRLTRQ